MSAMTTTQAGVFHPELTISTVRNLPGSANELMHLGARKLERLDGDNRWRMIICREGLVWITQERDWRDYVLTAGDVFVVTQRGSVLIQALQDASVEITPSLKTVPHAGDLPVFD